MAGSIIDLPFCAMFGRKHVLVTLSLVLMVLCRSLDQALYYRLSFNYGVYSWFLAFYVLPIGVVLLSWPMVLWKRKATAEITPDMLKFPQSKFVVLGGLDAVFAVLSTWPIYHLGGMVSNVVSQLILPFNMLLSFALLKTRYKRCHYVGSILAIYGVLVRLIPGMVGSGNAPDSGSANGVGHMPWQWVAMLVSAQLPGAASNVFKEHGLKLADMDIWLMNGWVGLWQFAWGILLLPMAALPMDRGLTWERLPSALWEAALCFTGDPAVVTTHGGEPGACDGNVLLLLAYLAVNTAYNVLMLFVFKHASSVLFVIAATIRLPLVDLLLLLPAVAGAAKGRFTIYDAFALVACVLGIFVYYSEREESLLVLEGVGVHGLQPPTVFRTAGRRKQRRRHGSSQPTAAGEGTPRQGDPASPLLPDDAVGSTGTGLHSPADEEKGGSPSAGKEGTIAVPDPRAASATGESAPPSRYSLGGSYASQAKRHKGDRRRHSKKPSRRRSERSMDPPGTGPPK